MRRVLIPLLICLSCTALWDVFPCLSFADTFDGTRAERIHLRNSSKGKPLGSQDTYLLDVLVGDLGLPLVNSSDPFAREYGRSGPIWVFGSREPPFRYSVTSIIGMGPGPKVIWIPASRIISRRAVKQSIGNGSLENSERYPVGVKGPFFPFGIESPVSVLFGPLPYPARSSRSILGNESEEPLNV